MAKLVVKGTEAQAKRHAQLSEAAQILDTRIQNFAKQRRTFVTMQDEVSSMRATTAPEMLREVKARYPNSGLDPWNDFLLVYKGDVDEALAAYIVWVDQQIANMNGIAPPPSDPNVALIGDAEDLSKAKLAVIKAEMLRLEKFISADTVIQKQYAALASRVSQENKVLATLQTRLTDAKGAAARRKDLQTEREAAYGRVFDAIIGEQSALMVLYSPLVARLAKFRLKLYASLAFLSPALSMQKLGPNSQRANS